MIGNNLKKNKKDIVKITFIVGLIIGVFLIVAGILIFWSEGFNDLLIKLISFIKQKSPYLLVDGKPVYTFWLIKLISLGRLSIIVGTLVFLFSLIIFINHKFYKTLPLRLTLLSISIISLSFFCVVLIYYHYKLIINPFPLEFREGVMLFHLTIYPLKNYQD